MLLVISSPFSISDPCAVKFKIIGSSRSSTLPAHELRDFSNTDWNSISELLTNCDWPVTVFIDCITCEDFITAFYTKLNEAIDSLVPLKVFRSTTSPRQLLIHSIFVSSTEPSLPYGVALSTSKH